MVLRLTTNSGAIANESGGLAIAGPGGTAAGDAPGLGRSPTLALAGPGSAAEDESMVSLGSIEGAVRASSLRAVATLVDKNPEESLAVMRSWMVKEGA
jgi:flagellar biosynthesis/type III secretory pathway M-ring protein FliF/YscJ